MTTLHTGFWDGENAPIPLTTTPSFVINEIIDSVCMLDDVPVAPIFTPVALRGRISEESRAAFMASRLIKYEEVLKRNPGAGMVRRNLADYHIERAMGRLYTACLEAGNRLGLPRYVLLVGGDRIYCGIVSKLQSIGFEFLLLYPRGRTSRFLLAKAKYCFCYERVLNYEPIVWSLPRSQLRVDLVNFDANDLPPPPPPPRSPLPPFPPQPEPRPFGRILSLNNRLFRSAFRAAVGSDVDVETQPNRHGVLGAANRPDLILTGQQDNAEFALAMCPTEPFVLSGGKDKSVVLWSIKDPITTVGTDSKSIMNQTGEGGVTVSRNLTSNGVGTPIYKFEGHKAAVFGSSGEDGLLNICDYERMCRYVYYRAAKSLGGLFFQHAGHRVKVVDFHRNALDPWTIVSVSDDKTTGGDGTLQIWRMSDLIYRPEEEVLTKFQSHVMICV